MMNLFVLMLVLSLGGVAYLVIWSLCYFFLGIYDEWCTRRRRALGLDKTVPARELLAEFGHRPTRRGKPRHRLEPVRSKRIRARQRTARHPGRRSTQTTITQRVVYFRPSTSDGRRSTTA